MVREAFCHTLEFPIVENPMVFLERKACWIALRNCADLRRDWLGHCTLAGQHPPRLYLHADCKEIEPMSSGLRADVAAFEPNHLTNSTQAGTIE
jgi:hypothetical protein